MRPAQPFGRRGVAAAATAQPRFANRPAATPRSSTAPEPTLASLGLEKLGSAAASAADRGALWMLFSFQGRLSPGAYRLVRIVINLFAVVFFWSLAKVALQHRSTPDVGLMIGVLLADLVTFPLWIWTTLAMQIKRWHDRDKAGVWVLVGFIPVIGPLWTLVELMILPGSPGPNRFGPSPNGDTAAVFE